MKLAMGADGEATGLDCSPARPRTGTKRYAQRITNPIVEGRKDEENLNRMDPK
jgi:hypothetical protein